MQSVKFLGHPLIIGILAAILQYIDIKTSGTAFHVNAWLAFQAWALYFLAGCTLEGGKKSIIGWVCGIVASIPIIEIGMKLMSEDGAAFSASIAFPIAVFIIAFIVILFEKVPHLNFIPAWFVAAGGYFALGNIDATASHQDKIILCLIAGVVGLSWGWMTVFLRGKYAALVEGVAEEPVEPAAE